MFELKVQKLGSLQSIQLFILELQNILAPEPTFYDLFFLVIMKIEIQTHRLKIIILHVSDICYTQWVKNKPFLSESNPRGSWQAGKKPLSRAYRVIYNQQEKRQCSDLFWIEQALISAEQKTHCIYYYLYNKR